MSGLNFGIEYELENIRTIPSVSSLGWRVEHDGTLRNHGVEFVLADKQNKFNTFAAISGLLSVLPDNVEASHRCSMHVHVDATNLSVYAKLGLAMGLMIHDDYFYSFSPDRKHNSYCCPTLRSPAALLVLNAAHRAPRFSTEGRQSSSQLRDRTPELYSTDCKYLGINPMPLTTFGTYELRHFSPIMELDDVHNLLNKIEEIYNIAASTRAGSRTSMIRQWDDYASDNPEYADNVAWVKQMLNVHSQMTGAQ